MACGKVVGDAPLRLLGVMIVDEDKRPVSLARELLPGFGARHEDRGLLFSFFRTAR
jgi:hypothetical protein